MGLNSDYRHLLKSELENRCRRNPRYSLRCFARDLQIAPARLSDVIRGRYGLSRRAAADIGQRLGFSISERRLFCDLVESQHARSPKDRLAALKRVKNQEYPYTSVNLDVFCLISDWYHFALLELMTVRDFKSDAAWMAQRLGLNLTLVKLALERLEKHGFARRKRGHWITCESFSATPTDVPSAAIKKFHQQVLERAIAALQCQNVDQRDFSGLILAFNRDQMSEAKAMIKDFRRSFDQKFGKVVDKEAVYCLTVQFFQLDEGKKT